jgi:PAS domain S-box-containing protein
MEQTQELSPLKLLFESLSDQDEWSQRITDLFPAIIYVYDADSQKLKYINRKVTEILGYTYDDVKEWKDDLENMVFTEDLSLVKSELEKFYSLKDNETHSYDARLNNKQGSWRYFRTMGTVLRRHDDTGKASSILFIAQDITGEVQAGNQFKRIEELFNDTQEVLKFGVWEWDVPANRITWSNGLYKLLGYDPKTDKADLDITPEFYLQHIVAEDREKMHYNQEHWQHHHAYDQYYKIRDKNGRIKDVRDKAKVIRNDKNELLRVIGSTIDITEQLQLYRDLADYKNIKQENERFLGYGTWEYDARNNKYFWSDGMYKLFGYDPDLVRGKITVSEELYKKHLHEDDFERGKKILEAITRKKKAEENYSWEYRITGADGSVRKIETSGKMVLDKEGNWLKTIGTSRDITRLHEYQQSLEEKIRDLNRSNKELEEFAYIASHDMNEPLRKITTFIERLEGKYKNELGAEGKLYLSRITASVENMRLLIDTLLEFSRTARNDQPFVKMNLKELLTEVVADLELKIEETNTTIDLGELPVIECVPAEIKQLFNNLLSNSIKFRKKDSPPHIGIGSVKLSKKEKEQYRLPKDGTYYQITIRDNGIGFETEYNERIFQIFQRLHGKTEYPGSGIGLAICKKIADHHSGVIYAAGESDKGATFTIILPEEQ